MKTVINATLDEVQILPDGDAPGVVLRFGQSVDYKGAAEDKASIGKIIGLKYAGGDSSSAWMNVADMGNAQQTEWISCATWYTQFGANPVLEQVTTKTEVNASAEPEADAEYPF